MTNLLKRFNNSIQRLRTNFPELERLDKSTLKQCNAGGIDGFLAHYDDALAYYETFASTTSKTQATDCEWGQYSVCLVLAGYGSAATGPGAPLVYTGAAYLCLCS